MIASPHDFREDKSTFERLSRMQHYSLPTRMLDTSTNPLVALWFACRSGAEKVGEVIRLTVVRDKVKYYDSDTVACLANLALLDDEEIGSASCRERVCQYVEISVVAASLKK